MVDPPKQFGLVGGAKHGEGLPVDVDDADLLKAARDELRMHLEESGKVANALGAHFIQQVPDMAEVLDPQRHRGVLEKVTRITLAAAQALGTLHFGGDILQRHQHPPPVLFVAWQDARMDLHVQAAPVEGVVHRAVGKLQRSVPQRRQLIDQARMHIPPEHLVEPVYQRGLIGRCEKRQGALVDP